MIEVESPVNNDVNKIAIILNANALKNNIYFNFLVAYLRKK